MFRFQTSLIVIAFFGMLMSCKKENGCYVERGDTEIREFYFDDFHTIHHGIVADFVLNTGPQQVVRITGNKSVLDVLEKESYVENEVLYLGFQSCVKEYAPLTVELTLPNYVAFTNDGAGNVSSPGELTTIPSFSVVVGGTGDLNLVLNDLDSINIELEGSGNLHLSGNALYESILISGDGVVDCFNLAAQKAHVNIIGNSSALVSVSDSLTVEITGNGSVYYKGYPVISENISGNGSVIDAN